MQLTNNALAWLCTILEERFGHPCHLQHADNGIVLTIPSQGEGEIIFPHTYAEFFESRSDIPFATWDGASEGWQCVLGEPLPAPGAVELPSPLIEISDSTANAHIQYDILGLTYWMLNRIEEIGRTDLDNHQRFPAIHSHAYKHNYLERPVVDEWLHLLGQVIQKVWPSIELKKHEFSMKVSHDVDAPAMYQFKPWKAVLRIMAGHLLKRRDIKAFFQAFMLKLTASGVLQPKDPYNTFDWLMDVSEQHGLTSAFYFICGRTSARDADYEPEAPAILDLMQRIHKRGHEIGLHPSYGTFQKPELIRQEADRLRAACELAGVQQEQFGGRMHYLRWEHPTTLQAWNDAGMAYDSTLSYADRPGFRCGTCYEYPAFNAVTQQQLNIRIRPLIAMECTVIDDVYLGLSVTQAAENKFLELKERCSKLSGCFTLLWHNSYFHGGSRLKQMYQRCIEG